jgi:sulfate adenylyltransferase large subunit
MGAQDLSLNHAAREVAFRAFLDAHLDQEMLRFTTAGSVDDGKSTLIGRLLHDTKSVYEDQLASIRASRSGRAGAGVVDLSLLTDGLKAEREQGITIDVAYRYFSTTKRKFIIADTPGHEQYTRNMATGASTADVAIVLIDAKAFVKLGTLLPQSRRHTYIASLLRIPHVVAAVNKMDIVDYDAGVFDRICEEFTALATKLGLTSVEVIPISALVGDNVVEPGAAMPWYTGPTLLEYLETVPLRVDEVGGPLRFPVQLVVRPNANFRGFAGRVERGEVRPGMRVKALPSGRVTRVKTIVTYDGELSAATAPRSVTLELEDEIDLSRGEMLVAEAEAAPFVSTGFRAMVVWMHEQPLVVGQTYLAKHTTRTVRATVRAINYRVDIVSARHGSAEDLHMNDIAEVEFETSLPLFFDAYAENREMGALILIDAVSNATVGAAMIVAAVESATEGTSHAAFFLVHGGSEAAESLRARLLQRGDRAVIVDDALIPEAALAAAVRALQLAGVTAISARADLGAKTIEELRKVAGEFFFDGENVEDAR